MPLFPATRHSVVAAIAGDHPDLRRSAFDTLVTVYWKPVFKYVRVKWRATPDDAADLTQAFFLRALEKDFFAGFDPGRARFRTYLRVCLDGFVANALKAGARLKRGGDVTMVPLDFGEAEREFSRQVVNGAEDMDAYFRREWLRGLFACAIGRLRDACAARGRDARFGVFERYDLAPDAGPRPSYADLARQFDMSPTDVTNELAAARREFRRLVLAVLREQCGSEEEFDAERQALSG